MKKWIFSVVCLMLFSSCSSVPTSSVEDGALKQTFLSEHFKIPYDFLPKEINIVALGDSLTEGVGDEQKRGGYVAYLEQYLEQHKGISEVTATNLGKRGLRSTQLKKIIQKNKKPIREADLILITIGGNDMMKVVRSHFLDLSYSLFVEEQQAFASRLDDLLQTIRTMNRDAFVVLIGLYNPFSSVFQSVPEVEKVIDLWNDGSEQVVSQYDRMMFVHIADVLAEREDVLSDDQFHPNNKGYQLIATRIHEQLKQEEEQWLGRRE
ncbi:SGNH/GDSL hydrolase family protein [Thermolongibacillus altinsuensis]|nr:SGNH/GDSL hydrolase family protein [Thermolongibacillus altinsuensis]